jgi:hypothetical protein
MRKSNLSAAYEQRETQKQSSSGLSSGLSSARDNACIGCVADGDAASVRRLTTPSSTFAYLASLSGRRSGGDPGRAPQWPATTLQTGRVAAADPT